MAKNDRSIGELFSEVSDQLSRLVRAEINLAKAEIQGRLQKIGTGTGLVLGAVILAFYLLGVVIATAIIALSIPFEPWLAGTIVAVFLLLVIALLAWLGIREIKKGTPPTPLQAIESTKQDVTVIKEGIHQ
ncbi:phage holin family protein [Cellulomonas edaphi]|uniref:Phage holin family protein n=1 Tax=Cellulomonas edaphi TaxID=3053468 RepID=A0ABT7S9R1_9CELL|nr:phage holin family protein [Cellulomons edaphi]MDM7832363.1 phage holin family protein [Cellulomons edaphi]